MSVIKPAILLSIVFLYSIINSSAQIRIDVPEKDMDNSVCGRIENEKLTIPAYKFRVLDKNGKNVENLRAVGSLEIDRSTWLGGVFDKDAHWETKSFSINIPIAFDSKDGLYISKEVSNIKIEKRKTDGIFNRNCLDLVKKITFNFYNEKKSFELFYLFLS